MFYFALWCLCDLACTVWPTWRWEVQCAALNSCVERMEWTNECKHRSSNEKGTASPLTNSMTCIQSILISMSLNISIWRNGNNTTWLRGTNEVHVSNASKASVSFSYVKCAVSWHLSFFLFNPLRMFKVCEFDHIHLPLFPNPTSPGPSHTPTSKLHLPPPFSSSSFSSNIPLSPLSTSCSAWVCNDPLGYVFLSYVTLFRA